MGVVATASVKITADTSGLKRGEADVSRFAGSLNSKTGPALKLVADHGTKAHLSMGKLKQELQTLTRQVTGTNPVVTQLAGVLGEFALGGPLMMGVLGGVAALAFAYDKLTASTRKAREENEKLGKSLIDRMKLKALGPGGSTQQEVRGAVSTVNELGAKRIQLMKDVAALSKGGGAGFILDLKKKQLATVEAQIAEYVQAIVAGEKDIFEARQASIKGIEATITASRSGGGVVGSIMPGPKGSPAIALTGNNAQMSSGSLNPKVVEFSPEEKARLAEMAANGKLQIEKEQANAEAVKGAIAMSASLIVSALNLGGGGRGSSLGGALGGGLGAALGAGGGTLGFMGGPLGSVVGTIAGSLVGGAFDKMFGHKTKKAANNIDGLAQAARMATEALTNLPSGFKIARYRFNASDAQSGTSGRTVGGNKNDAPIINYGNIYVSANSASEIADEIRRTRMRGGSSKIEYSVAA